MNYYQDFQKKGIPDFDPITLDRLQAGDAYLLSPALQRAVDLAIFLGQPLLLTGEPGTGKTELARHLASHFSPEGTADRFHVFNTKTTSTAQDLFYRYDSLRHFHYVQNHRDELSDEEIESRFIDYQALGKAIKSGQRAVVLIDEIDKAPRDFPNDILDVMVKLSFEIPELGWVGDRRISTDQANRPIVILTSNSEKDLPNAFLRRCVFFHIEFPDDELLERILAAKIGHFSADQLRQVVAHFHRIRSMCKRKQPSTAELLQWTMALEQLDALGRLPIDQLDNPNEVQKKELLSSYSILVKDKEDLKQVLE
ncbi:MAG: MoxR family ATPase [Saprospiraceae bacterium]